jgi:hypothetical protein
MTKIWLVAALVLLGASNLLAQGHSGHAGGQGPMGGTHHGFPPPSNPPTAGSGFPVGQGFRGHRFHHSGGVLYPWPYLYPDYADYNESYEPPAPPPAQPPVQAAVPQPKSEPPPEPVLLEWRGNQWVRVNGYTATSEPAAAMPLAVPAAVKEIPPTVLVYRDGHNEELTNYSLIGSSIYTKSDYWTNGAWTRTIQIADLDIPATLKENQQRGVKFELPSGPNEVMIRP